MKKIFRAPKCKFWIIKKERKKGSMVFRRRPPLFFPSRWFLPEDLTRRYVCTGFYRRKFQGPGYRHDVTLESRRRGSSELRREGVRRNEGTEVFPIQTRGEEWERVTRTRHYPSPCPYLQSLRVCLREHTIRTLSR